jgi:hypothetical protein
MRPPRHEPRRSINRRNNYDFKVNIDTFIRNTSSGLITSGQKRHRPGEKEEKYYPQQNVLEIQS